MFSSFFVYFETVFFLFTFLGLIFFIDFIIFYFFS